MGRSNYYVNGKRKSLCALSSDVLVPVPCGIRAGWLRICEKLVMEKCLSSQRLAYCEKRRNQNLVGNRKTSVEHALVLEDVAA